MIKSFKDKRTEALFRRVFTPRFPITLARIAAKKLSVLHYAVQLNDLRVPPSNHSNAYQVEVIDYH